MLINVSDFVGFYLLAKNTYAIDQIQEFIDEFERPALNDLLGAELSQILIDDSGSGEPVDADLLKIFNPFDLDLNCGTYHSNGIKKYLAGIIYYNVVSMNRLKPSINGGLAKRKVESAEVVNYKPEATARYNSSIDTSRAIQAYILENLDKYPTFKGRRILYNCP